MYFDNVKESGIMGEKVPGNKNKNTKSANHLLRVVVVAAFLAGGCATTSSQTLEKNIETLERELVQLGAERVNWAARNNALDDQVLVLEKKLERCQEEERQDLKVVRLLAGQQQTTVRSSEPESEIYIEPLETRHSGNAKKNQGKRQVLVLRGNQSRSSGSQVSARTNNEKPVSSQTFTALGTDNLGVVKVERKNKDKTMETFNTAYRAYTNRQYDQALTVFSKFVHDHPNHDFTDNAIFWRGECYLATGQYFKAIGEFERLLRRYSRSDKRPSSLYRIGFAWDKLGDKDKALEYYFRVVGSHAGTDAARRASRRVSAIQGEGGQASSLMPTAQAR
jgi:tol-pal system protein YbgF